MPVTDLENSKAHRFESLVLVHRDAAFNLALWLTRNRADAEDIVQEAYLRAYRFFDGFRGEHARPWLLKIVRNTYYTAYNQDAGHALISLDAESAGTGNTLDPADESALPDALLEQADSRRLVNAALGELPPAFREILVLRELEDMSYRDIAAVTGIPIGTVMSRLSRARDLLYAKLRQSPPPTVPT
jgi:RNA polymerase sigma-70 factor (ECF subfamily)